MHLNITSVSKNWDEAYLLLSRLSVQFSVIALSETFFTFDDKWIDLPNFIAYHSVRSSHGGGGFVLVSSQFRSEVIEALTFVNEYYESCALKLFCGNKYLSSVGVYRPPSCSLVAFNEEFFRLIESYSNQNDLFLLGDFNVNLLKYNECCQTDTFRN